MPSLIRIVGTPSPSPKPLSSVTAAVKANVSKPLVPRKKSKNGVVGGKKTSITGSRNVSCKKPPRNNSTTTIGVAIKGGVTETKSEQVEQDRGHRKADLASDAQPKPLPQSQTISNNSTKVESKAVQGCIKAATPNLASNDNKSAVPTNANRTCNVQTDGIATQKPISHPSQTQVTKEVLRLQEGHSNGTKKETSVKEERLDKKSSENEPIQAVNISIIKSVMNKAHSNVAKKDGTCDLPQKRNYDVCIDKRGPIPPSEVFIGSSLKKSVQRVETCHKTKGNIKGHGRKRTSHQAGAPKSSNPMTFSSRIELKKLLRAPIRDLDWTSDSSTEDEISQRAAASESKAAPSINATRKFHATSTKPEISAEPTRKKRMKICDLDWSSDTSTDNEISKRSAASKVKAAPTPKRRDLDTSGKLKNLADASSKKRTPICDLDWSSDTSTDREISKRAAASKVEAASYTNSSRKLRDLADSVKSEKSAKPTRDKNQSQPALASHEDVSGMGSLFASPLSKKEKEALAYELSCQTSLRLSKSPARRLSSKKRRSSEEGIKEKENHNDNKRKVRSKFVETSRAEKAGMSSVFDMLCDLDPSQKKKKEVKKASKTKSSKTGKPASTRQTKSSQTGKRTSPVWRIEDANLDDLHPYPSNAVVIYSIFNANKYPVKGKTWRDVYAAAGQAIRDSGDEDCMYIDELSLTNGNELHLDCSCT